MSSLQLTQKINLGLQDWHRHLRKLKQTSQELKPVAMTPATLLINSPTDRNTLSYIRWLIPLDLVFTSSVYVEDCCAAVSVGEISFWWLTRSNDSPDEMDCVRRRKQTHHLPVSRTQNHILNWVAVTEGPGGTCLLLIGISLQTVEIKESAKPVSQLM